MCLVGCLVGCECYNVIDCIDDLVVYGFWVVYVDVVFFWMIMVRVCVSVVLVMICLCCWLVMVFCMVRLSELVIVR